MAAAYMMIVHHPHHRQVANALDVMEQVIVNRVAVLEER